MVFPVLFPIFHIYEDTNLVHRLSQYRKHTLCTISNKLGTEAFLGTPLGPLFMFGSKETFNLHLLLASFGIMANIMKTESVLILDLLCPIQIKYFPLSPIF